MYTSLLVVVLSVQTGQAEEVNWNRSYYDAQAAAASQNKPLAVVLGTGAKGYNQIVREGTLPAEIQDLIRANFVPVYIDTTTAEGQRLATEFQMPSGKGVVLSDRKGVNQAFWFEGSLTSQNLTRQLQQVGTGNVSRTSFFDGGAPAATGTGATAVTDPAYCPNCQNGGGRRR